MAATVAAGFVRWDPKLPAWWALWTWSMVFLTALPEEAVFRHLMQGGLQDWLGGTSRARWTAMVVGGVIFGLVHVAGGWTYVALATLAGIGYGWIYAASGSIAASILAHTGLNLIHLLFFSYPALREERVGNRYPGPVSGTSRSRARAASAGHRWRPADAESDT